MTKEPERRFASVGHCIYCGALSYSPNDPKHKLGDEHIVPEALRGSWVLPNASCKSCERITSSFELTCCRTMLDNHRIAGDFPTKHPKKRPRHVLVEYTAKDKSKGIAEVPKKEWPLVLRLLRLGPCNVLASRPEGSESYPILEWYGCDLDKLNALKAARGWERVEFNPVPFEAFVRMLAKIAHASAVAHFGIDGYKPLLKEIILGTRKNYFDYVGGSYEIKPPFGSTLENYPNVAVTQMEGGKPTAYSRFILWMSIRFFPYVQGPHYQIAAGEFIRDNPKHMTKLKEVLDQMEAPTANAPSRPLPVNPTWEQA